MSRRARYIRVVTCWTLMWVSSLVLLYTVGVQLDALAVVKDGQGATVDRPMPDGPGAPGYLASLRTEAAKPSFTPGQLIVKYKDSVTESVSSLVKSKKPFKHATTDFSELSSCDVINVCVPTPLTKTKDPDVSFIVRAARAIPGDINITSLTSTAVSPEDVADVDPIPVGRVLCENEDTATLSVSVAAEDFPCIGDSP